MSAAQTYTNSTVEARRLTRRSATPYYSAVEEGTKNLRGARRLAASMCSTKVLHYILIEERWGCMWVNDQTLHCPRLGWLKWVGAEVERPRTTFQQQKTKLFVVDMLVGPTVYQVMAAAVEREEEKEKKEKERMERILEWEGPKEEWAGHKVCSGSARTGLLMTEEGSWWWKGDKVEERVKGAIEKWKAQVPKSYHGALSALEDKEVYGLVRDREMTEDQFLEWVDQVAWDAAENLLKKDMKKLQVEEGWTIVKN
jgi:hypothetical protein